MLFYLIQQSFLQSLKRCMSEKTPPDSNQPLYKDCAFPMFLDFLCSYQITTKLCSDTELYSLFLTMVGRNATIRRRAIPIWIHDLAWVLNHMGEKLLNLQIKCYPFVSKISLLHFAPDVFRLVTGNRQSLMLYAPLLKENVDKLLSKIICHWKLRTAYWALAVRKQYLPCPGAGLSIWIEHGL